MNTHSWIKISVFHLAVVSLLGIVLRSKILFELPSIDYTFFLSAHSNFAFGGWITVALMTLMVHALLSPERKCRRIYHYCLAAVTLSSWGMMISFAFFGHGAGSGSSSVALMITTYVFSFFFIKDVLRSAVSNAVKILSVASLVSLVLSSVGSITALWVMYLSSYNPMLLRNASFSYLHFQYNGFFTLAVLSLLFQYLGPLASPQAQKNMNVFAKIVVAAVLPSLFLSYLWIDPEIGIRSLAIAGSVLVLASLVLFVRTLLSLRELSSSFGRYVKMLVTISVSALVLKMTLQIFTVFPVIGTRIFGDRTVIIAYLHLVFLAFVTLFILAYFIQLGLPVIHSKLTRVAILIYLAGVLLNEALLGSQGFGVLFMINSDMYPKLLWIISIMLFVGSSLLAIQVQRQRYKKDEA